MSTRQSPGGVEYRVGDSIRLTPAHGDARIWTIYGVHATRQFFAIMDEATGESRTIPLSEIGGKAPAPKKADQ